VSSFDLDQYGARSPHQSERLMFVSQRQALADETNLELVQAVRNAFSEQLDVCLLHHPVAVEVFNELRMRQPKKPLLFPYVEEVASHQCKVAAIDHLLDVDRHISADGPCRRAQTWGICPPKTAAWRPRRASGAGARHG
jgi:hypothetical protein